MSADRHALVFGATGLVGRHVVLALGRDGVRVSTAGRSAASSARLAGWLAEHDHSPAPRDLRVDFTDPRLVDGDCDDVTEIYQCAGAYRFGMSADEARRANVESVRAVVEFAARLPRLRRVVHVSGYRVGGQDNLDLPTAYRTLGAYEASKLEGDAVFRATAEQHGVPWTVVNPATVIGESDQYLGLAATLRGLWWGAVPASPGNARTFVPVVAADHLARFMTLLPTDADAEGAAYWLLDDATPALPDLLKLVAEHYRVAAPRVRIPVAVLRRLPRRFTRADPETLSFLSADRYPTDSARAFAARHGLTEPDTVPTILGWADHLAAHRFGGAPPANRRFTAPGGVRTFELGDPGAPTVVLPGLPLNADTWAPAVAELGDARAVDLPGLGLSPGSEADWPALLAALVTGEGVRHLVGHSIGAAAAVEAAAAHPDAVEQLTLVAPFFLQASSGAAVTSRRLRRVTPEQLSERLTGSTALAATLRSSVEDLRRSSAPTVARLLASSARPERRAELREALKSYPGRVHLIVGAEDPLGFDPPPRAVVTILDGAGHHPQLTHPDAVARAVRR
ncbi:alpha/beta fold hydrolase [Cryptosporangium aurantiacum]|uniref:Nucleoside-diphosphate-sugar epimerase n=1 Tax=Cryptosporangium aurantiacum TaxID=134849 RepID=A0A1M7TU02_9ACTN|nr:alpha/beta fold hydrolase [Cryptosporangium aurantiacum]SHN74103.1 Nucleoside-diphosphate-sugar epimerase [Cryptosporangium aurantiacum]